MEEENKIVIYKSKDGKINLDINFNKDTVWLTQEQISVLFDIDRSVVTRHINNMSNTFGHASARIINHDLAFYGEYFGDSITPYFFNGGSSGGSDYYARGYITGSGLINHNRVSNRLNTFLSSRGLPVSNY